MLPGDGRRLKCSIPFAEGPRNCMGQKLAKVFLLATIATLMQHFSSKLATEVSKSALVPTDL